MLWHRCLYFPTVLKKVIYTKNTCQSLKTSDNYAHGQGALNKWYWEHHRRSGNVAMLPYI